MAKAMTIAGMAIAGLIGLVFTLDLALGIPFGRASKLTDVVFMISAGIVGFLAWSAFRDIR
jgi:hypothetical protein